MEDLNLILSLISGHPFIAIGIAAYLLFFRGKATPTTGSATGLSGIFAQLLKLLLSFLEPQPPTPPGPTPPGPAPAPFDLATLLKRLLDEFLKAKEAGDTEHAEAVLKVMQKCETCGK